jgi:uncharacterized protein (DUF58 family)
MIFFSDKIEKFIPPKKGKSHILRIIRELIEFTPQHNKTNIAQALRYFTNVIKKRSIAFLISDFMDDNFADALKLAAKKHDIVGIRVYDEREEELPDIGLIKVADPETGNTHWLDTSSRSIRNEYKKNWVENQHKLETTFRRSGIDNVSIRTDRSYVQPLMNLFKRRERRA